MKNIFILSLLVTVAVASGSPVSSAIKNRYAAIDTSLTKYQFKQFSSYFSPTFKQTMVDGTVTSRKAMMTQFKYLFDHKGILYHKLTLISANNMKTKIEVKFDFKISLNTPKGKVQAHEIGTDTWQKLNGQWMIFKTVDSKSDIVPIQ